MNNIINKPQQIETRYYFKLTARNVLNKPEIKFDLSREFIDNSEVARILDGYGYNTNHPSADLLIMQIERSFTLPEINQFLNCLPPSKVHSGEIIPFGIMDADTFGEYYSMLYQSHTLYKKLDFSELVDGTLPFPVVGYYEFEEFD